MTNIVISTFVSNKAEILRFLDLCETFLEHGRPLTWCSMVVFEFGSMPAFRRCRRRRIQLHPFRRDLTLDGYPIHGNGPELGGGEGAAIMQFRACSKTQKKVQLGSVQSLNQLCDDFLTWIRYNIYIWLYIHIYHMTFCNYDITWHVYKFVPNLAIRWKQAFLLWFSFVCCSWSWRKMSCPNCSIEKPPNTPNTVFPRFFAQFGSIAMLLNRLEGLKMNSAEVDTLWYLMVYVSYGNFKMYACEHNFTGAWPRLLLDAFQMYGGGSTYGSSLLTDKCWMWITVHVHFGVPLIQTSFHMSWFKTFWDAWRRAICMFLLVGGVSRKTNMKRSTITYYLPRLWSFIYLLLMMSRSRQAVGFQILDVSNVYIYRYPKHFKGRFTV